MATNTLAEIMARLPLLASKASDQEQSRRRGPSIQPCSYTGVIERALESYRTTGAGWSPIDCAFSNAAKQQAADTMLMMLNGDRGHCVSFIGQTSVGKTMLCRIILKFWNISVPSIRYGKGQTPMFHHGAFISWPSHDWKDLEDEQSSPCVVLDEMGRGNREQARLIEFISFREARGLWTLITSNLSFCEIERWDKAIAMRLKRNGSRLAEAPSFVNPYVERAA